jgi:hypothetical protein
MPISAHRLNQNEYFHPFSRQYFKLLKSHLKQIQVMDHNGNFSYSYFTGEQDHDRRNPDWKPFQILVRHCLESGYDFYDWYIPIFALKKKIKFRYSPKKFH